MLVTLEIDRVNPEKYANCTFWCNGVEYKNCITEIDTGRGYLDYLQRKSYPPFIQTHRIFGKCEIRFEDGTST